MILDKDVKIKLTKSLIDKYNYKGESGDIIKIDVNDLPKGSSKLINVKCDICGKERILEYRLYLKNYNKYDLYTCYECSKIKYKKTSLNKYGVENPMQNEDIKTLFKNTMYSKYNGFSLESKEIRDKIENKNLILYGFKNPMQNKKIKEKTKKTKSKKYGKNFNKITEKIQKTKLVRYNDKNYNNINKVIQTNNLKYNCDFPLQNEIIYNKTVNTCMEKYGCYPTKNKEIRQKQKKSLIKTTFDNIKIKYTNIKFISKKDNIYTIKCDNCKSNFNINFNLFHLRILNNITLCTKCNDPKNKRNSDFQRQIEDFLKKNNFKIEINDRETIGLELDILIKDQNLAIECNGLYWHSELFKDKYYHINKSKLCQQKNIELLHIWEDDWKYKQNIVKSIILNKLGKTPNKIWARKTKIKEINDVKLVKDFLENNHIQGFAKSSKKLGLFYDNELVSLMTFGYRKINTNNEYELIRFCNKINTNVIGGASKLFKYFVDNHENISIYSYSDNSMFNGNLYSNLNFKFERETGLNYYWIVNNKKEHRFKYNKKKLISLGYDKNKTESEIMMENNSYKLWSCGMKKWKFEK